MSSKKSSQTETMRQEHQQLLLALLRRLNMKAHSGEGYTVVLPVPGELLVLLEDLELLGELRARADLPPGREVTTADRVHALTDCADAVREFAGPPPGEGYESLPDCVTRLTTRCAPAAPRSLGKGKPAVLLPSPDIDDPISALQIYIARGWPGADLPVYDEASTGTIHSPRFTVTAHALGRRAFAEAPRKADAKKSAARNLIKVLQDQGPAMAA